jgi:hypothetical protein
MSRIVKVILIYRRHKPIYIALTCWARSGDVMFPVKYGQTFRVNIRVCGTAIVFGYASSLLRD